MSLMDALHAPYVELLAAALGLSSPTGVQVAVDLGCGAGSKAHWLMASLAPDGLLLGIDRDRAALAVAATTGRGGWIVADAHTLPIASASVDCCWSIAALDLFTSPATVLAEVRRILRPGGRLVVASVSQQWVRPRAWPAALHTAWAGQVMPAPADGLGASVCAKFEGAGFTSVNLYAYQLEPLGTDPIQAALPLADWATLAPWVADRLTLAEQAACQAAEELVEPEPRAVLFIVVATMSGV